MITLKSDDTDVESNRKPRVYKKFFKRQRRVRPSVNLDRNGEVNVSVFISKKMHINN